MTTVTLPITLLVLLDLHVMSIVLGMDMDSTQVNTAVNTGESSTDGSPDSNVSTETIEDVKQKYLKKYRGTSPRDLRRKKSTLERQLPPESGGDARRHAGTLQAINELLIEAKLVCNHSFIALSFVISSLTSTTHF